MLATCKYQFPKERPRFHLVISNASPLELRSGVRLKDLGVPDVTDIGDPTEPCTATHKHKSFSPKLPT